MDVRRCSKHVRTASSLAVPRARPRFFSSPLARHDDGAHVVMSNAAEGSGARRSRRDRIRPLDFWANERVVYERGQICGVITNDVPRHSAERPQRIATPPKVVASPPKRARSSHREEDSLSRGDTKRSRRPTASQAKGQSRGQDDTAAPQPAAPQPAAPRSQPHHASPKVPLQPPPKKRRRELIDEVAAVDEDALVGLEDLEQVLKPDQAATAATAATAAGGAGTETAPGVGVASSAPQPSAEVGAARARGMASAVASAGLGPERAGTEKYGGVGRSEGGGGGDGGDGGGKGESQTGCRGSDAARAEATAAATAARAAVVGSEAEEMVESMAEMEVEVTWRGPECMRRLPRCTTILRVP